MGTFHHFRERLAFSGVSRYYTIFLLLIPLSYHRKVEKKHTIIGMQGADLLLVHHLFFIIILLFFRLVTSAIDPRPSGIDCDWAKFGSYPGLRKGLGTQFGQDSVKDGVIAFVERSCLSKPVGTEHLVRRNRRWIFVIEQDWYQHRYISQIYNRPLRWRHIGAHGIWRH